MLRRVSDDGWGTMGAGRKPVLCSLGTLKVILALQRLNKVIVKLEIILSGLGFRDGARYPPLAFLLAFHVGYPRWCRATRM